MLNRIVTVNFKGLTCDFSLPQVSEFSGKNGTGKTTLIDAILWCQTGKDSKGRDNHDIKTRKGGEVQHHLDHFAELHFDSFSIRRLYKEKWKKRTAEFSGHETKYQIDNGIGFVDVLKKDYDAFCVEKFGADSLLFSDPFYFAESLHWEKRRKIVNDAIEGVDEKAIAESVGVDCELFGADASATRKSLKKMARGVDESLDAVQVRIDENTLKIMKDKRKTVEEVSGKTKLAEAEKKVVSEMSDVDFDKFNTRFQTEKDAISAIDSGQQPPELQKLRDKRAGIISENTRNCTDKRENVSIHNSKVETAKKEADQRNQTVLDAVKKCESIRLELKSKYMALTAKQWAGNTVCPTCSQSLPDERIEEIKADFNMERADGLAEINKQARENKAKLENFLETPEVATEHELKELPKMYNSKEDSVIDEIDLRIEKLEKSMESKQSDSEKAKQPHLDAISEIEKERDKEKRTIEQRKQPHFDRIKELENEILEIRVKVEKSDDAEKRIAELQAEILKESDKKTQLMKNIDDIDRFIEAKITAMEQGIFDRFGVKFKMFDKTIDGNLIEMCEVLVDGESSIDPFPSSNRGHQIKTGVKLCSVLQEINEVDSPILVDNFESVTEKIDSKRQLILTTVSKDYNKITQMEN